MITYEILTHLTNFSNTKKIQGYKICQTHFTLYQSWFFIEVGEFLSGRQWNIFFETRKTEAYQMS